MTKRLNPKTLKKSFNTWFLFHGCSQQAESMLGMSFAHAMSPVIDELYESKEEKSEALQRHLTLFNTEQQVGVITNGIVCGLEESNANGNCDPALISGVKVALIGPTSAIGDSLWVATVIPLLLTIALSISQVSESMVWLGPVLYMIAYPLGTYFLGWNLFKLGYSSGLEGMQRFMSTGRLDKLTSAMTVLGLVAVGGLTASFVNVTVPFQIVRDIFDATSNQVIENFVVFNADQMLNAIFPKIVPLLLTLAVYYLYSKKKWSPMKLMGLILIIACLFSFIGYQTGFYS